MAETDSPLARALTEASLGALQEALPLKGELPLPDGGAAPAWLCFTDTTVAIAAATDGPGAVFDLATAKNLRYIRGYVNDQIRLGEQTFDVPFRRGDATRDAIAAARIRVRGRYPPLPAPQGPYIQADDTPSSLWLSTALPKADPVIAWLPTATRHVFSASDSINRSASGLLRLLISADQVMLVAVSAFGDVFTQPLATGPIEITDNRLARDEAALGDARWKLPMNGLERLRPLQRLPALSRPQRLREAARLLSLNGSKSARRQATALLSALDQDDPLDRLSQAQLTQRADALEEILLALAERDSDAGRVAEWLRRWEVPLPAARQILAAALSALPVERAGWALPLHRQIRDMQLAVEDDLFAQAEVDLELAEHLLMSNRHAEAVSILEPRRERLPDEALHAVLPPSGAQLTAGEGGQPLHIRALELLARARGEPETPDAAALAELARHQPLLPTRLAALSETIDPKLSARADEALRALKPGGFHPAETPPLPPVLKTFDEQQLELLRHPVARDGGALGWIQAVLAKVTPPDHSTIRDYCEKISIRHYPELIDAVADACVALGMAAVPAYISKGDRRLGIRSYEIPEPFLLIGGDHLDPEEDAYLHPSELRAAISAELTHLRFKHSRITSSDLWAGVWDKSAVALETTAMLLPFLKYLPVDFIGKERTISMVRRVVPLTWLQRIYDVQDANDLATAMGQDLGKLGDVASSTVDTVSDGLGNIQDTADKLLPAKPPKPREAADVGLDATRILAAHRAMQLTADRAALVMSGDLIGTLRSMFVLHSRLLPELGIAERAGLHAALARTGEDGSPILSDLTVRVAALIAFYLSEDYDRLQPRPTEEE